MMEYYYLKEIIKEEKEMDFGENILGGIETYFYDDGVEVLNISKY